jgi:hypothetical protein
MSITTIEFENENVIIPKELLNKKEIVLGFRDKSRNNNIILYKLYDDSKEVRVTEVVSIKINNKEKMERSLLYIKEMYKRNRNIIFVGILGEYLKTFHGNRVEGQIHLSPLFGKRSDYVGKM